MRRHHAVSLQQATLDSPTLARLTALAQESYARLQAIEPLLPPSLRRTLQAGPIDGNSWCLLVGSTAAAAKLRQFLPDLQSHLCAKGWDVASIRLKVQTPQAL